MVKVIFKQLFVYSQTTDKYFFTTFSLGLNIVYGRNTSGKSTLLQSIIYSMGINDSKENLDEIFKYDPVFRLDCELHDSHTINKISFVRSDDTVVIKIDDNTAVRYDGINGNNSYEYGRYKDYFSQILNFNLKLQSKNELVKAPLETALLPFYISQSVGWVYIRESIGDYRFYKDFRYDYLDYYSGLSSSESRARRNELLKTKKNIISTINQVKKYKNNNVSLSIADALDKRYKGVALEYLERFSKIHRDLVKDEKKHSQLCNDITSLKMRSRVLAQVIRHIDSQKPQIDKCPTCEQTLPGGIIEFYHYTQDVNDALNEKKKVAAKIKAKTSELNSTEKRLSSVKSEMKAEYEIFNRFDVNEITFDTWLDYHANLKIIKKIDDEITGYYKEIDLIDEQMEVLGEDNLKALRRKKDAEFLSILREKISFFDKSVISNSRYNELYSITSFPLQGVDLHKMVMAYHFSFIDFIKGNKSSHIFPFMLDAVFKEDIDTKSRKDILRFIASEAPSHDQLIFTIAEIKEKQNEDGVLFNTNKLNNFFFSGTANLICIGEATNEKSFLSSSGFKDKVYINETLNLIETF